MRQDDTLENLVIRRVRECPTNIPGDAAPIVIGNEGRHPCRFFGAAFVVHVGGKHLCQHIGPTSSRHDVADRYGEREIDHMGQRSVARVLGRDARIRPVSGHLAKYMEIRDATFPSALEHCRHKAVHETSRDVFCCVDAEAVDFIFFDPVAIDTDETVGNDRIFQPKAVKST